MDHEHHGAQVPLIWKYGDNPMSRTYAFVGWVITVAIPLFLIMTAIRLLLNPLYLEYQYNRAGFPPDPYGFTVEDRLHWGKLSLDYLVNDSDISFLGDLEFDNGTPIYNQRELEHMHDVKVLVQQMLVAWWIVGIGLVSLGIWAWRANWLRHFWQSISRGGFITTALILGILLLVMVSFNALFTGFHRIFFEGNTWIFLYSDTLIRLFPLPLWQDAFIFMGVFSLAGGLILGFTGRALARR
jgi:integral membrane protein (TIGR01906 family)